LKRDDQAALVTFSQVIALGAPLTHDAGRVERAIEEAAASGDTALVDGTYAAITLGESDAGRALVIVFSDGVDTASWLSAGRRPHRRKTIGRRRLRGVGAVAPEARIPPGGDVVDGGRLFEVEKTAALGEIFVRVLEEFSPPLPCQLHPAGRREGRLAPAGRAGERAAVERQGAARLSRGNSP
jgi:hypothetical protein